MPFELYLLVDATASMTHAVASLPCTLRQLYLLRDTMMPDLVCRVIVYRDYDCSPVVYCYEPDADPQEFAAIETKGGGDTEEASKTGLVTVLKFITKNALVIHYAGSGPHIKDTVNARREIAAIGDISMRTLANGFLKATTSVVTFCDMDKEAYTLLGAVLPMPDDISKQTMIVVRAHLGKRARAMHMDIELFAPFVNATDIKILLYNPELAALWRHVRVMRTDRAVALRTAVAACADAKVREWVINTFSKTHEIEYLIDSVDKPSPFIVLRGESKCTRRAILSLANSPHGETLAAVQDALLHLVTATGAPPNDYRYIPFDIDDADFFAMIPHLVTRDLMYGVRPAAIVALMVYKNEDHSSRLGIKAAAFLTGIRGTWLPMDDTDSVAFVRFINGAPFLTDTEKVYYEAREVYFDIQKRLCDTIEVYVDWSPERGAYLETELAVCAKCNNVDTITTMENELCISCRVPTVIRETAEYGTRFMARCSVCHSVYGIARPSRLRTVPKCHWCCNGLEVHRVQCTKCHISVIKPDVHPNDSAFRCRVCPPPKLVRTTVEALCTENPALLNGEPKGLTLTVYGQKIISNHDTLFKRSQIPECAMCFEPTERVYMQSPCGRCDKLVCALCLDGWYGQMVPGEPVTPAHTACPFCKRHPKLAIMNKFNREASFIRFDDTVFLPHLQYGWCRHCYMVKPWGIGVVCVVCAPRQLKVVRTKACPKCNIPVSNVGGADHVICDCGTHFCWTCFFEAEEIDDIFDHICK